MSGSRKFVWILLAAAACVAVLSPVAFAQDARAVKKVEEMNRAAMEDYDLLEFEAAKKRLNEALLLVKKSGLAEHKVAARTHLNLGIVYAGGLQDYETATVQFANALQIDPSITLNPAYKTPELQRLLVQAKETIPSKGPGGGGGGEDDTDVVGLRHTPVDEAVGGKPVTIKAKVGADVKAKQVILYYRAQGKEEFVPVVMRLTGGVTYQGDIPAEATRGDSVHYYIEARNSANRVNASNGNNGSPNIVVLSQPAGGGGGGGDDIDDEDPLGLGGGGGGGGGGDDGTGITKRKAKKHKTVFFTVAGGGGAAFVTGLLEKNSTYKVNPGFAPNPIVIKPEIGFWLSEKLTLSVYGHITLPQANEEGAATVGPAGVARVTYSPAPKKGLLVHGDLGAGLVRQQVALTGAGKEGMVDTHASGPLLLGGGFGYIKALGGPLHFVADVNVLAGLPIMDVDGEGGANPQFGVNIDATVGIAFAF